MAKKILFVGEMPSAGEIDSLAALCDVTPAKFSALFDYGTIFAKEVPWVPADAVIRADALLADTVNPVLVLCGERVAAAFGVGKEPMLNPFPLGIGTDEEAPEQVRLVVKIMPSSGDKLYRKKGKRRLAKGLLRGFVTMSQQPATEEEARRCCAIVRNALGDNMDIITRQWVDGIEKDLDDGKGADKYDLGQLMLHYARNVDRWVKPK